jgi:hypothetical protein
MKNFALLEKTKSLLRNATVVNPPLFNEDDDMYVIEKCIIPELHVLQGFVNHLFWNGLVPLLGKENALLWPRKLKLIPKNYHGHSFERNACRKLLKESDAILEADVRGNVSPLQIVPFISAFKAMNKVIETCFSNLYVDPDVLENQLNHYKKCLLLQAYQKLLKSTVLPVT